MADKEKTTEDAMTEKAEAPECGADNGTAEGEAKAAEKPAEEVKAEEAPAEEKDPLKAMEKKLEAAEEKTRQEHDRLLRLSAEFENYKKRSQRELSDFRKFANESLIKELLTVVDNLERAIAAVAETDTGENSMLEGVDMTLKGILKVFEKYNVKPVDAAEKPFDPNFHQAVMQEETEDHPEGTVIKELQKGYLLHDRLIRPAMVVVAKAKA